MKKRFFSDCGFILMLVLSHGFLSQVWIIPAQNSLFGTASPSNDHLSVSKSCLAWDRLREIWFYHLISQTCSNRRHPQNFAAEFFSIFFLCCVCSVINLWWVYISWWKLIWTLLPIKYMPLFWDETRQYCQMRCQNVSWVLGSDVTNCQMRGKSVKVHCIAPYLMISSWHLPCIPLL